MSEYGDGCRVAWCETHDAVAVVYDDGSTGCWWELVVETHADDHHLISIPTEMLWED